MPSFQVRLLDSAERFACESGESVLDGMARLGRRGIASGCRGGACGVCKVEVVAGSYTSKPMSRSQVSARDEAAGTVLACRIAPTSDLALRVVGAMGRAWDGR